MLKIREITCKTLLNKSNLSDFTLNCYVGCSHRCLYCYARYMKKFKDRPEDWGDFVDVKVNAPEVLAKQLRKIRPPKEVSFATLRTPRKAPDKIEVFMSSICDGWQPLEAKYKLSRACLKLLLEAGFEVSILTKSSLIERDFDILSNYKTPSLGMTMTTLNLGLQKALEPYASETRERLNTLKKAQSKGIKTWVFLGPLIPEFSDTRANLEGLFRALEGLNLSQVYVDKLNPRWGVLNSLKRGLGGRFYFNLAKYAEYSRQLKEKTVEYARQSGLSNKLTFCF
ncbi:MAG: radical SAM protein [Candidatus Omnitrophica bacterium]|nr:radical SAM protein [Candidatus Omnitrophota bacterium]MDD5353475.1 radical SAM protein [Candidatus Omnitrophota bacterium]MDD5591697.1 radical SAM protein [Candidatus Omnitrophota bacterium]